MRRVKPGDFAQVDGLHGFFQMGLDVSPQFVRVCLFGWNTEGRKREEMVGRYIRKQGETVGGGSGGGMKV